MAHINFLSSGAWQGSAVLEVDEQSEPRSAPQAPSQRRDSQVEHTRFESQPTTRIHNNNRRERSYQKVISPPSTQKSNVTPTLWIYVMMLEGVEYIPAPTTRLMMRKAVDHVPSFLSEHP